MSNLQEPFDVQFRDGDGGQWRNLRGGDDCHVDEFGLGRFLGAAPSDLAADLFRIATSVYVIDRKVRRRTQSCPRRWGRPISVRLELAEPDFWRTDHARELLRDILHFIGDDDWEFEFRPLRDAERVSQSYLRFSDDQPPLVCLYSGGLDSTAGLHGRLTDAKPRQVMPITVRHQPRQRRGIERQFDTFKGLHPHAMFSPLFVKVAVKWGGKRRKEETSQRCRSFLFCAVGGVAALLAGSDTVEVYESGVGAINLPLTGGMVGSKATRGCHPAFLKMMSDLVGLVGGQRVTFTLPFGDQTKGQMVSRLGKGAERLARQSVSCAHYPLRERPHKQCGVCASCVFRRQAMAVAGIVESGETYKYDLFGTPADLALVPVKKKRFLNAFLGQAVKLNGLDGGDRLPDWVRRHIFGTGILGPDDDPSEILALLTRYRDEWRTVAGVAAARGLAWARGLSDPRPAVAAC